MAAFGTARASKAVGQDAALQVVAELPLDIGRDGVILPAIIRQAQVGLEMFLDYDKQDHGPTLAPRTTGA